MVEWRHMMSPVKHIIWKWFSLFTVHHRLSHLRKIRLLTCCEWCCNGLRSNVPLYCDEADGVRGGRQQPLDRRPCLRAIQRHLRGVGTIWGAVAQDEEVSGRGRGAPGHQHRVECHLWQVEVSHGSDSWRNSGWSSSAARTCWSQAGHAQLGWKRKLDEDGWQASSQGGAKWRWDDLDVPAQSPKPKPDKWNIKGKKRMKWPCEEEMMMMRWLSQKWGRCPRIVSRKKLMMGADVVVTKYDADFRWCNELEPE